MSVHAGLIAKTAILSGPRPPTIAAYISRGATPVPPMLRGRPGFRVKARETGEGMRTFWRWVLDFSQNVRVFHVN
jgi:hypothetical protein